MKIGVFIIKNATVSRNNSGLTLSVSLSDKMSLLNGDIGGIFPATINFSENLLVDEYGNEISSEQNLIEDIIRTAVNEYGGIQLGQIFINDIGRTTKGLMKWGGKIPIYADEENRVITTRPPAGTFKEVKPGDILGYKTMAFVWPGSQALTCNAGESVVTLLDKIKNALGNFEYFFDIFGNFFFQQKRNFTTDSGNFYEEDNGIVNNVGYLLKTNMSKTIYEFTDANIITSFQNAPKYENIKNDYIVWGERKTSTGSVPIRYHLAINEKPTTGNLYLVELYDGPYGVQAKRPKLEPKPISHNYGEKGVFYYTGELTSDFEQIEEIWTYEHNQFLKPENPCLALIRTTDWRTEVYLKTVENIDNT
jgi:hypothetical protein